MKKFIIEKSFWEIFPHAKIGVVICHKIDNSIHNRDKFEKLISDAEIKAQKYLSAENFTDNQVIRNWRNAYQKFKTKKGARSSIEALLKRVKNGNKISSINPLVDIYNTISLSFGLPCGGEDIDQIVGDMKLTKAKGTEEFLTLGSEEITVPYQDEFIYKDDVGTICRSLNWRESKRTMLTETTKKAVLCLELIEFEREAELKEAIDALAKLIVENLGGKCQIKILNQNSSELVIDD